MNSGNVNFLVEKLVATVGRAFYTDSIVVVLDTLLREKFIREEELGPRLKLQDKEVRKIIQQLESEMLIKFENIIMDDNRSSKCYYIDYQLFVNVIRYRIFLMQKSISSAEKNELNEVYYECPTCKQRYSQLDAQKLLSADFKFICSSCCPFENFRENISAAHYRLIEVDNRRKLNSFQSLASKMDTQLTSCEHHEGIFDLLFNLKDTQLIRNLPSENRKRGLGSSRVVDADVEHEISEIAANKKVARESKQRSGTSHGPELTIVVEGSSVSSSARGSATDGAAVKTARREAEYPEFLQNSRIYQHSGDGGDATLSLDKPLPLPLPLVAVKHEVFAVKEEKGVSEALADGGAEQDLADVDWED